MTEAAYRQLTNQQYYCKLEEDPSEDHANKIKDLVQEMYQNGHLDKRARSEVIASRSGGVRLSFLLVDLVSRQRSLSTADKYVSKAGSLFLGGFQVLFSLNRCWFELNSSSSSSEL